MAHEERAKLSTNVEMYLETIYTLTEDGGSAKTSDIATEWQVAPASATEMVQKLAKLGLVDYKPYHGARLSVDGLKAARGVIRKHRLLELFLAQEVALVGDRVHDVACDMEHTLAPEVEVWVCSLLGHPREGLEGKPVPPGPCCPKRQRGR